jgi:hypothetical protein
MKKIINISIILLCFANSYSQCPAVFDSILPICKSSIPPSLPTTSTNGISGTWNNAISTTNSGIFSYIFTPSGGCLTTTTISIKINELPPVDAGVDQTVCAGTSVTLSGLGADTYSWNNGVSNSTAFTPALTLTYTLTGTNTLTNCSSTDQMTVNVKALPNVQAGTDVTVCNGQSVILSGSGANTYSWSLGVINGASFVPTTTATYTLTGTAANGCTNVDQVIVNVKALPNVQAGNDVTVCNGQSVTLSGSGANTYSWNLGIINGASFVPTTTTTYTLTGTAANGCTNVDQVIVNVNALPNVQAGPDVTVCSGQSVTLSGLGANTYSWNNGISNSTSFIPTSTTTYTVTGTNTSTGCSKTDQVVVTVNALPTLNAGPDQSVCEGTIISLNASVQSNCSFVWNNGIINAQVFIPTATTTYTLTATNNTTGCVNTDQVSVVVNLLPTVNAGQDVSVCSGNSIILNASGANSYSWSNNVINGESFVPNISNVYIVTGYSVAGCSASDQINVTVKSSPFANAGNDFTKTCVQNTNGIPIGSSNVIGNTYSWSPSLGLSSSNISNPTANPSLSTSYTLTVTGSNGCTSTDQILVTVDNQNPIANAGGDFTKNCIQNIDGLLIGSNSMAGNSYSWSPLSGLNSSFISSPFANPTATTNYTLTVTGSNGCVSTDQVLVTVNVQAPAINAGNDFTKTCVQNINGSSIGAISIAGNSYSWTPSSGLSSSSISNPIANPEVTTNYFLTVTGNNGCTETDQILVTVDNQNPLANAGNDFIKTCNENINGLTIGSSIENGSTYSWIPTVGLSSANVSNPFANPTATTNYTLTVTGNNGCVSTDLILVTVNTQLPVAIAGNDFTKTCIQNASGMTIGSNSVNGNQYVWTPSLGLSSSIIANPIANPAVSTNYTLTVTGANGCSSTDQIFVVVNNLSPIANAGNDVSICQNEITNLSGTGGVVYSWFPTTGLSSSTIFNPIANPAVTTNYILTVTGSNGCSDTDSVKIIVNELPNVEIVGYTSVCQNSSWIEYSVSPTSNNLMWSITNGEIMSGFGLSEVLVHWLNGSDGQIMIEETDLNNCANSDTLQIAFTDFALDQANIYPLSQNSNILYADNTYPIMNWGYQSISNNIPIYLDIHTQYCEFNVFDPANYYYWVEIGDGNGCLTKSYFNQPQFPNSIEENSLTNLIKVYPNPTSEVLYLQLEELVFEKINFNVFDISGKILFEGNLNNVKTMIDVSILNSSIYFIEFTSKDEKYTMKFIKD